MIKDRLQLLNPVTKKYAKINTKTGSIIGYKSDKNPYKNVEIRKITYS